MQPDAPYQDRLAVAGRVWTTEVALARQGSGLRFGIRVFCASLPYAIQEIALTRPRVVVELALQFELRDVHAIKSQPWHISSEGELERFRDLLLDRKRSLPVYLLTQPNEEKLGLHTAPFLLDADDLARRTFGLAHVVTLPNDLGFRWTNMVGKPWSAYLGAVRTYRPGLRFEEDRPTDHPLAIADRILAFQYRDLKSETAFADFLEDQALSHSASKRVSWAPCLFYADAVRLRAELTRRATNDAAGLIVLYEEEITALKEGLAKADAEAEAFNDDAIAAERDRDGYIDENRRLRVLIDSLRHALEAKTGESADSQTPIPNDYDEVSEWAEEYLAGRVVLHQRAVRSLKDARYEDPQLVCRALLLLANEFRNMKLGYEGANEWFEQGCAEMGLDFGGSISRERAGEEGDTYFIRYPSHSGEPRFLEYHLRKGSSKDQRYCLAIYFLWDDKTNQVIIGSLPAHLENRMT